jgi:hypothetical protein
MSLKSQEEPQAKFIEIEFCTTTDPVKAAIERDRRKFKLPSCSVSGGGESRRMKQLQQTHDVIKLLSYTLGFPRSLL